jgi:hypothetical protein
MARLLALVAVLAVVSAAERPRLYGLKKIAVSVSADPDGDLDRDRLRQLAVSKLQAAGIHVDQKSRSHLNVIIGLSTIRTDKGAGLGYAYSVNLSVSQQVYLAHNPNRLTDAVTWQMQSLGTSSAAELSHKCEQILDRRLDEFVSVYLEATQE